MKVSPVRHMREMDRRAMSELGIPGEILMENAGAAAFRVLADMVSPHGKRLLLLCGPGNNGGDTFVVARHWFSAGGQPRLLVCCDPESYTGAARVNANAARCLGIPFVVAAVDSGLPPSLMDIELDGADAVVDGLFGTGLTRPVTGRFQEIIVAVNRRRQEGGPPVLALDIPSGIHGDTGQMLGDAIRADATVTFGLPKPGNLLYPGADLGGRLFVAPISLPPSLREDPALTISINPAPILPPRPPDGHKGSFGKALFIAGARGYYGAPGFAAAAFLKAGGGYARLAAPADVIHVVAARHPEIVFEAVPETSAGGIAQEARDRLLVLADWADVVVMGPGLGADPETHALVRGLCGTIGRPLILDGDGLTAMSGFRDILRYRRDGTALTPHPLEMSRLTGLSVETIVADCLAILTRSTLEWNAHVVLKGAHSLIGSPDGQVWINTTGNSGMGTAGSGDVLTGIIAALAGLGLPLGESLSGAAFLHGLAGDLAARRLGEDGVTAPDILTEVPAAMKMSRDGIDPDLSKRYSPSIIR